MATSLLGIDLGADSLKLAYVYGGEVKRTLRLDVPRDVGMYTSAESFGEYLRNSLNNIGLRAHDVAVTLPHDKVNTLHTVLTCATDEEAAHVLPQKFDGIAPGSRHQYLFDYLTLDTPSRTLGEPVAILAACTRRAFVESLHSAASAAGLRLVKISPAVCSYISMLRAVQEGEGASFLEYCIMDFGFTSVRLYMFRSDRLTAEYELRAEPLKNKNFDKFADAFTAALEHYRSRHPHSPMTHVWPLGGGASEPMLRSVLADRLKLRVHRATELIPGSDELPDAELFAQAVGIALYLPGREPR